MTALVTVYWLCFVVGLLYVLAAGVLGALGGHGAGGHSVEAQAGADGSLDSGGFAADGDVNDLDGGGDGAGALDPGGLDAHGLEAAGGHGADHGAGAGHGGYHHDNPAMEYNPFSPLSLMGFVCAFGATGLIATAFSFSTLVGLALAAGGGLAMALLMWLIIGKLLFGMQGSSEAHQADMIGLEADVLTPLEEGHLGEIAYILDGVRYTAPAKLMHEGSATKLDKVRIRRIRENVVFVEQKRKLLN